jgi:hypothetical protein
MVSSIESQAARQAANNAASEIFDNIRIAMLRSVPFERSSKLSKNPTPSLRDSRRDAVGATVVAAHLIEKEKFSR